MPTLDEDLRGRSLDSDYIGAGEPPPIAKEPRALEFEDLARQRKRMPTKWEMEEETFPGASYLLDEYLPRFGMSLADLATFGALGTLEEQARLGRENIEALKSGWKQAYGEKLFPKSLKEFYDIRQPIESTLAGVATFPSRILAGIVNTLKDPKSWKEPETHALLVGLLLGGYRTAKRALAPKPTTALKVPSPEEKLSWERAREAAKAREARLVEEQITQRRDIRSAAKAYQEAGKPTSGSAYDAFARALGIEGGPGVKLYTGPPIPDFIELARVVKQYGATLRNSEFIKNTLIPAFAKTYPNPVHIAKFTKLVNEEAERQVKKAVEPVAPTAKPAIPIEEAIPSVKEGEKPGFRIGGGGKYVQDKIAWNKSKLPELLTASVRSTQDYSKNWSFVSTYAQRFSRERITADKPLIHYSVRKVDKALYSKGMTGKNVNYQDPEIQRKLKIIDEFIDQSLLRLPQDIKTDPLLIPGRTEAQLNSIIELNKTYLNRQKAHVQTLKDTPPYSFITHVGGEPTDKPFFLAMTSGASHIFNIEHPNLPNNLIQTKPGQSLDDTKIYMTTNLEAAKKLFGVGNTVVYQIDPNAIEKYRHLFIDLTQESPGRGKLPEYFAYNQEIMYEKTVKIAPVGAEKLGKRIRVPNIWQIDVEAAPTPKAPGTYLGMGFGGLQRFFEKPQPKFIGVEAILNLKRDITIHDVAGNKFTLPAGEAYTPNIRSDNKILLTDGQNVLVNKNTYEALKGVSKKAAPAKEFAPELVQIKEITKSEKPTFYTDEEMGRVLDEISLERYGEVYNDLAVERRVEIDELASARAREPRATKFQSYQLPGGTNYREVLLQAKGTKPELPLQNLDLLAKRESLSQERFGKPYNQLNEEGQSRIRAELYIYKYKYSHPEFTSSHWEEPNVLAWLRLNDRTTAGGQKVLFIEEVQSDWASKVRREGITDPSKLVQLEKYKRAKEALWNHFVRKYGFQFPSWPTHLRNRFESIKNKIYAIEKSLGIIGHPLLKEWLEVDLKQALKMAVDGGYDHLSWVTGQQTADRYNISRVVESITWEPSRGKWTGFTQLALKVKRKDEIFYFHIDSKGIIDVSGFSEFRSLNKKSLEEAVGKDVAKKILSKPQGELREEDLVVGGEWAKNLYDVRIPGTLKSLTGQEIKEVSLELRISPEDIAKFTYIQQSIEITPEVRAIVKGEALPLKQPTKRPVYLGMGLGFLGENPWARLLAKLKPGSRGYGLLKSKAAKWDKEHEIPETEAAPLLLDLMKEPEAGLVPEKAPKPGSLEEKFDLDMFIEKPTAAEIKAAKMAKKLFAIKIKMLAAQMEGFPDLAQSYLVGSLFWLDRLPLEVQYLIFDSLWNMDANYLEASEALTKLRRGWIKELKLSRKNETNAGEYLLAQDPLASEALEASGIKPPETISPSEQKLIEYAHKVFEEGFDLANKVFVSLGLEPMGHVEHYMTLMHKFSETDIFSPGIVQRVKRIRLTKVGMPYQKIREGGMVGIETNISEVVQRYMNAVYRLAAYGKAIKQSMRFIREIEKSHPNLANSYKNLVDYILQGGRPYSTGSQTVDKALTMGRKGLYRSIIPFNFNMIKNQFGSLVILSAESSIRAMMGGIWKFIRGADISSHSKIIKSRHSDLAVEEAERNLLRRGILYYGGMGVKFTDYWISRIVFEVKYQEHLLAGKSPGINGEAFRLAEIDTGQIMGMPRPWAIPPMMRYQSTQTAFMFNTTAGSEANVFYFDILGAGKYRPGDPRSRKIYSRETLKRLGKLIFGIAVYNTLFEDELGAPSFFPRPLKAIFEYDLHNLRKGIKFRDTPYRTLVNLAFEFTKIAPYVGEGLRFATAQRGYGSVAKGLGGPVAGLIDDTASLLATDPKNWSVAQTFSVAGRWLSIPIQGAGGITQATKVIAELERRMSRKHGKGYSMTVAAGLRRAIWGSLGPEQEREIRKQERARKRQKMLEEYQAPQEETVAPTSGIRARTLDEDLMGLPMSAAPISPTRVRTLDEDLGQYRIE